ncbi:MAG: [FeFe] hydrogenase H-cluster radical SAM maturase HydE [Candidatus Izemoplasmatales bacterium]
MISYLEKLSREKNLKREEYLYILDNITKYELNILTKMADKTRKEHYQSSVYLRGLIEFSNICSRDCKYCGIRMSNHEAKRFRMTEEEILSYAKEGYDMGYRTFVLQSGEDAYFTDERICSMIRHIKKEFPDAAITLGIGEKSKESYQSYFDAGCDRYLLRHESASKRLYEYLHPEIMSFENRIECLWNMKEIGYQVGAGFMVNSPTQSNEDLVEDFLFLEKLQPHMVGIGPFIAHSKTPFKDFPSGTLDQVLVCVALTRLILPEALLPSTTALGTVFPGGREKALKSGANVVMPSISEAKFKSKYELYENRICIADESIKCRGCIEGRIVLSGYEIDLSRGDHPNMRRN